jgi:hypothetical protein
MTTLTDHTPSRKKRPWNLFDIQHALCTFRREHGHMNVPKSHDNQVLARWVKRLRIQYRAERLPRGWQAALEVIGFEFDGGRRGTLTEVYRRLADLEDYRDAAGDDDAFPSKHDPEPRFAAFNQWLYRMRKALNGGNISAEVIEVLEEHGIPMARTPFKERVVAPLAEAHFQRNLAALKSVLGPRIRDRRITYGESLKSEPLRVAYRFLEHLKLKNRQGILPKRHLEAIESLDFQVNDQSIRDFLTPTRSLRAAENAPEPLPPVRVAAVRRVLRRKDRMAAEARVS